MKLKKWPKGLKSRVNKAIRAQEKAKKNSQRNAAIETARKFIASGGKGTKPDLTK